tara:strand:- start:1654 stop:2322 length:669 start_codon:yes stop_codon:yes gene_type:complete
MGLLELYNQITNGILPTGDDKKHIDNMPLGNPQWENKNDTTTDYGNTDQITGTPTPNQYPAGPIEPYTQIYNKDNTYLSEIYTNLNNDTKSPLSESLDSSRLDNLSTFPDYTTYPVEANSTPSQTSGKYYTEEFTPSNEYDDNVGLIDGEYISNISNSFEGTPILDEDIITQYPNNNNINFGGTQVKGINPITGKSITEYSQKYNSNSTYYDHLEEEEIETR